MKINLDFYKSDICVNEISSNTVKSQINQIIKDAEDFEYESAINTEDINNEVFNSISSIRKNIINWYDFKVTDRVLEINLDNGIITDFLCQKFNHVTSVCFDYNHFELIKDKLEKYDNLEVIIGALDDINFDEKYDYILLFNCYENHYKFYNKKNQILLKYLSNLLKKEGTILLAIDNPVSVKRLVGGIDTYGYNSLSMFTGFTKDKLVKQLNENGFKYNFYYPLPDYKMTSVIFSDRYLPDVNNSKLLYNFNYEYPSNILANEHVYLIESIKNNLFDKYTNSYFIEIKNATSEFDIQPKFVSFNNYRKSQFRNVTKMYEAAVIKEAQTIDANKHINNIKNNIDELEKMNINMQDTFDNNKILSKYCTYELFNKVLANKILNNEIQVAIELIRLWQDKVLNNIITQSNIEQNIFDKYDIEVSEEILKKLHFIKLGFYDLVFENTFFDGNNFFIYDQEWKEEGIPVNFILYRAINNLYMYSDEIDNIYPKEDMLNEFYLTDFCEIFAKLEQKIQSKVLDCSRISIAKNNKIKIININELDLSNFDELRNTNQELLEIKQKYNQIKEKADFMENELAGIRSSKMYKIINSINKKKGGKNENI